MQFKSSLIPYSQLKLVNKFGSLNSTVDPVLYITKKNIFGTCRTSAAVLGEVVNGGLVWGGGGNW